MTWSALQAQPRRSPTETLGSELKRPPSDSAFRYFFLQVDVTSICATIRDWTLAQISVGATDLAQLVCDGKTLRDSIEATATGGSAFIVQVTLYSAALGLAITQGCYETSQGNEHAELKKPLGVLDLEARDPGVGLNPLADRHNCETPCNRTGLSSLGGQGAMRGWGCHTNPIARGFPSPASL